MPLNIKDPVTERLAAEVARLAGETKTGAIRTSLLERKERLALRFVMSHAYSKYHMPKQTAYQK